MYVLFDLNGILVDFRGKPVVHRRELPQGVDGNSRYTYHEYDRKDLLPIEGWLAGMNVVQFEPVKAIDPVCLYDRWGQMVHQWPHDYVPSFDEVRDVVIRETAGRASRQ